VTECPASITVTTKLCIIHSIMIAQLSSMLSRSWTTWAPGCRHAEARRCAHLSPSAAPLSYPVHGFCLRPGCAIPISVPPLGTAGGCTWIEPRGGMTSIICLAAKLPRMLIRPLMISGLTCGDFCSMGHLLPGVNFFHADFVRGQCMPWRLHDYSLLQGCLGTRRDAVCSIIAALALLVGASVVQGSSYGFACHRF
jgi:hypothetical protein